MGDVREVLRRLDNVKKSGDGWRASCPVPGHGKGRGDKKPSLSVAEGDDGEPVFNCFVGCRQQEVRDALGLDGSDSRNERETVYTYHTASGEPAFEVVRGSGKQFFQRQPDGTPGRGDVDPIPHRLPEVLDADGRVFIAEGEKDVETLRDHGLTATCNPGGAGNWRDDFSPHFEEKNVVILPDNDDPGRDHAQDVADSLEGVAESVRIVQLPGLDDGEDVTDWFAEGGTVEDLLEIVEDVRPEGTAPSLLTSFREIESEDLRPLFDGRLFMGKQGILGGPVSVGKSLFMVDLAARFSTRTPLPGMDERPPLLRSLFLSAEDAANDTIKPRLEAAGADMDHVFVLDEIPGESGPRPPSLPEDLPLIEREIERAEIDLVFVDPISAYLPGNTDTHNDSSTRKVLHPLQKIAERTGAGILAVKHFTKSGNPDAKNAIGGSIAFTAAARYALVIGQHPADEDRRVLATAKNNLKLDPPSLEFEIVDEQGVPRIRWLGTTSVSADDIAAPEQAESKLDAGKSLIEEHLADGPTPAAEIYEAAEDRDISETTVKRASKVLDVEKERREFQGAWFWSLPPDTRDGPLGENGHKGGLEADSVKGSKDEDEPLGQNPGNNPDEGNNAYESMESPPARAREIDPEEDPDPTEEGEF